MSSNTDTPPLAKYFASTEKKTRDKAVKNLAAFLSEAPGNALSRSEMDKLWKGIFYCFWMSDKPLVQQALASELAELLLAVSSTTASLAFLRGFWTTIVREWNGIDRLRIDKFYLLIRRFVNASFRLLIKANWDEKTCSAYNSLLISEGGPLHPTDVRVPMGLPGHLSDVYLEELEKAISATSEQSPLPVPLGILLDPFFALMAQTSSNSIYKRIESSLLKPLLDDLSLILRSDDELTLERARMEPRTYPNLVARTCMANPQGPGSMDQYLMKRNILRSVFEIASRPETKDVSRRKMYRLWKEEGDGDED
ncbi:hypothetical protein AGABI1DRAFT_117560 [Agaricus bisporus var. burnettii JB137-S8]|uniref:Nop52-domain-containing protein n=2 Tax=Agaricus bisporus var. burnettii TaxID=192524 RepID=K5X896_AGABU|nr:uncharacterized protein AGABI1DRAFT_117560 [Agaricus bisporus var. burnettii JB137-S8]EKM84116.1 hypothetical protein AGABI1DRAFT_117560 [Agaricus bisporus var. burnettii JB137-S8]KAF7784092.1 hypothetical protein Agabi119p4_257 [Agaricus bisporus var. burnettii]